MIKSGESYRYRSQVAMIMHVEDVTIDINSDGQMETTIHYRFNDESKIFTIVATAEFVAKFEQI